MEEHEWLCQSLSLGYLIAQVGKDWVLMTQQAFILSPGSTSPDVPGRMEALEELLLCCCLLKTALRSCALAIESYTGLDGQPVPQ